MMLNILSDSYLSSGCTLWWAVYSVLCPFFDQMVYFFIVDFILDKNFFSLFSITIYLPTPSSTSPLPCSSHSPTPTPTHNHLTVVPVHEFVFFFLFSQCPDHSLYIHPPELFAFSLSMSLLCLLVQFVH